MPVISSEFFKSGNMRSQFFLLLVLTAPSLFGQSGGTAKAPAPNYLNQVYYYKGDSLLALGRTDGRLENKMKALGFAGSQSGYYLEGTRSAMRIRTTDTMRFIVKLAGGMMDPSMLLQLYRFDSKKDYRMALISSHSRFGGEDKIKNVVHIDIQKSGADAFILIPSEKLVPGEYGFLNKMALNQSGTNISYTFYDFGVDP
jgi:hypothetical protein